MLVPLIPLFFTAITVFKRLLLTTSSPYFSSGIVELAKRERA